MANRILGSFSLLLALACYGALGAWVIRLAAVGGGVAEVFGMFSALGWRALAFVASCLIVGTGFVIAGIALLSRKES